jgi:hypothetical protein
MRYIQHLPELTISSGLHLGALHNSWYTSVQSIVDTLLARSVSSIQLCSAKTHLRTRISARSKWRMLKNVKERFLSSIFYLDNLLGHSWYVKEACSLRPFSCISSISWRSSGKIVTTACSSIAYASCLTQTLDCSMTKSIWKSEWFLLMLLRYESIECLFPLNDIHVQACSRKKKAWNFTYLEEVVHVLCTASVPLVPNYAH